jgi:hypothetical protein
MMTLMLIGGLSTARGQQTYDRPQVVTIRVARTIKSVTYRPNSGQTTIGMQGTALIPLAKGELRVQNKQGVTYIEGSISKLEPASKFGGAYLTYVLWAITPEGVSTTLAR